MDDTTTREVDMTDPQAGEEPVRLGLTTAERRLVLTGFPLTGAAVGAVLPLLWRLVRDVDWVPFHGPLESLMSLDHGWQTALRVLIVASAGLVLALVTLHDDTVVVVGRDRVVVEEGGTSRTIERAQVAGVRHDGKHLVIETAQGRRLLDASVEGGASRAAPAFRRFGYPWEND